MSPFANALKQLRSSRGLRQQELADLVGCPRTYVSALENDHKSVQSVEFVARLAKALNLDAAEKSRLEQARESSCRTYSVSPLAAPETFELYYELSCRHERLTAPQIRAIRAVLEVVDRLPRALGPADGRIRRRDRRELPQEGAM